MARMTYPGVVDPRGAFEQLTPAVRRLQAMAKAFPARTPAAESLEHAVMALRMAANLLTRTGELYGVSPPDLASLNAADLAREAEFDALRPALTSLQRMARAYHPATPEARSLEHAASALRMAADLLTGTADFFRIAVSDGSTPPNRERWGDVPKAAR